VVVQDTLNEVLSHIPDLTESMLRREVRLC